MHFFEIYVYFEFEKLLHIKMLKIIRHNNARNLETIGRASGIVEISCIF